MFCSTSASQMDRLEASCRPAKIPLLVQGARVRDRDEEPMISQGRSCKQAWTGL